MTANPDRKLTKGTLSEHGIRYDEDIHGVAELPSHVEDLRDFLLSFNHILPNGQKADFDNEKEAINELAEEAEVSGMDKRYIDTLRAVLGNCLPNQEAYESKTRRWKEGPKSGYVISAEEIASAQEMAKEARWYLRDNVMESVWASLLHDKVFREYYKTKGVDPLSHE